MRATTCPDRKLRCQNHRIASGCRAVYQLGLIAVLLAVPAHALAQGGPPLIVDDPDTPGPGFWEINVASVFERSQSEHRREVPLVDINYGVGERIQLKFEVPWLAAQRSGESVQTGVGNSIAGVKWRFLGQEGQKIAWAIYPQLGIATGRSMAEKGFVEDGVWFLLPTEFTLQIGHVEINTEVGRTFVEKGAAEWFWGVASEIELPRTELLAELHGDRPDGSATELIAEVGARQKITRQIILLAAVGTGVRGPSDERLRLRAYFGIQFNLPYKFTLNPSQIRASR